MSPPSPVPAHPAGTILLHRVTRSEPPVRALRRAVRRGYSPAAAVAGPLEADGGTTDAGSAGSSRRRWRARRAALARGVRRVNRSRSRAATATTSRLRSDLQVEAFVKERIRATWDEPVLGEEGGLVGEPGPGPGRPVGRRSDRRDLQLPPRRPVYGVSIAWCERGVPTAGAVHLRRPARPSPHRPAAAPGSSRRTDGPAAPADVRRDPARAHARRLRGRAPRRLLCDLARRRPAAPVAARAAVCLGDPRLARRRPRDRGRAVHGERLGLPVGDLLIREAGGPPCCDAGGAPIYPVCLEEWLAGTRRRPFLAVAAGSGAYRDDLLLPLVRRAIGK